MHSAIVAVTGEHDMAEGQSALARGPASRPGLLLGVALVAAAIGCSSAPPPKPVDTPAGTGNVASNKPVDGQPAVTGRGDTTTPTSSSIHVDDKIMKACGDVPTAHFAFDSARIQPDAGAVLDAIARCFVSGPLKGHSMKLIGHADPRGEHEYNFGLGQKRAGSVAAYLSSKGLQAPRIQTSSKGDTDATGVDEAGWARDCKVDVLLAD